MIRCGGVGGGEFCRPDAYRWHGDVSQQTKLGAGGVVDGQLGLQQAQLQEPNGRDDGTEVEEHHGGEPKRGPPKEKIGRCVGIFTDTPFFFFLPYPGKEERVPSVFFPPKEVSNFRQAIILIIYANPT